MTANGPDPSSSVHLCKHKAEFYHRITANVKALKVMLDLIVSTERKTDSYVQEIGSELEELLHWACKAIRVSL